MPRHSSCSSFSFVTASRNQEEAAVRSPRPLLTLRSPCSAHEFLPSCRRVRRGFEEGACAPSSRRTPAASARLAGRGACGAGGVVGVFPSSLSPHPLARRTVPSRGLATFFCSPKIKSPAPGAGYSAVSLGAEVSIIGFAEAPQRAIASASCRTPSSLARSAKACSDSG